MSSPPISEQEKYRKLPWSLAHITLNNFFYTWTFGSSIFILFLSELGLPKDQIGALLSLFPFAGLLALIFGTLVARWGRKKVYLIGYGTRKPVMASLLLLPWILSWAGYQAAIIFLFIVILSVACLRAIAETAFIPWFQEYVPNPVRGKYASATTILTTGTSMLALAIASWVIANRAGLESYMLLIGAGAVIGLVGVALMWFVPGGEPIPAEPSAPSHSSGMRLALKDKLFRLYLGATSSYAIGAILMGSFLPLFMKEELGLQAEAIVRLEIFAMLGGALASIVAGMVSDRFGSRPVLMPGLILSIGAPIGWLVISYFKPTGGAQAVAWITILCGVQYFAFGSVSTAASIAAGRMLYNQVIPFEKNTSYTSVYYAWTGLVGGSIPLLAGLLLTSFSGWQAGVGVFRLDGYGLLFLFSLVAFSVAALLYNQVRPESEPGIRMS